MDIEHSVSLDQTEERFITTLTRREITMMAGNIARRVEEIITQSVAAQILEKNSQLIMSLIDEDVIVEKVTEMIAKSSVEAWKKS